MAADAAAHAGHAKPHHDYHLVDPSPWPIVGSISAFLLAIGGIAFMKSRVGQDFSFLGLPLGGPWLLLVGAAGVLYTMYAWWSDVIAEGQHGDHTPVVRMHHRYGMMLFIASEVMFFVAWFWMFFEMALFHEVRTASAIEEVRAAWGSEFHFTGPRSLVRSTHEFVTLWVANERLASTVGRTSEAPANPPWQVALARKAAAAAALLVFAMVAFKSTGALG